MLPPFTADRPSARMLSKCSWGRAPLLVLYIGLALVGLGIEGAIFPVGRDVWPIYELLWLAAVLLTAQVLVVALFAGPLADHAESLPVEWRVAERRAGVLVASEYGFWASLIWLGVLLCVLAAVDAPHFLIRACLRQALVPLLATRAIVPWVFVLNRARWTRWRGVLTPILWVGILVTVAALELVNLSAARDSTAPLFHFMLDPGWILCLGCAAGLWGASNMIGMWLLGLYPASTPQGRES